MEVESAPFISGRRWMRERPHILVVACSDGRYQECLDEFLASHLGIASYDRLYAPGGPGALASSIYSYFRGEHFRQETAFLMEAHGLEEIVLIYHGPAVPDGPPEATCADYIRKKPFCKIEEIILQQTHDLREVTREIRRFNRDVRLRAFRAEVRGDGRVQFIVLPLPDTPY